MVDVGEHGDVGITPVHGEHSSVAWIALPLTGSPPPTRAALSYNP
jgi:hypothetical protein